MVVTLQCLAIVPYPGSFYAMLNSRQEPGLGERIVRIYHANRQVYGSPRIHAVLRAEGQACGKKRVARLMHEHGLSAKPRRHRTRTTDSQHEQPVAPNLLNREFTATAPNRYTAADYRELLAQYGIVVSMSGKGDCYDSALMESFFGTLKSECVEMTPFKRPCCQRHHASKELQLYDILCFRSCPFVCLIHR